MRLVRELEDSNGTVKKFVFSDGKAITEVVGYRYQNRGVVCFSVQSGCPIGCTFCGTGKRFIRNLKAQEMLDQIHIALNWIGDRDKIQLMSMSMGEPMLNMEELWGVRTHFLCCFPGYQFIVSTVGVFSSYGQQAILNMAAGSRNFGLQFSLHSPYEEQRRALLGNYPLLLSITQLKAFANEFHQATNKQRSVYWNYICKGTETVEDAEAVSNIVGQRDHLTCSVLCNTGELIKGDPEPAQRFGQMCASYGVENWSMFDPAGQDSIGGGCGQLLYVQEFLNSSGQSLTGV